MIGIEVAELNVYPIKACAGISVEQAEVTEFGLDFDREWMLVGENGQPLTQRNHPELATVQTRMGEEALIAVAPGMGELAISLERNPDAPEVPVTLWRKTGTGNDEGPEATQYFTEFLGGKPARLLRVREPRRMDPEYRRVAGASKRTGFADSSPMLLTSTASLATLNESLAVPIPMNRFRPNVVVGGGYPYDEDTWRVLRIGDLRAFVVRACDRCIVPNVDQQTGARPSAKEPRPVTEALRATRQGVDDIDDAAGEFFGQNITHVVQPGARLAVGDPITVIERSYRANFRPVVTPTPES